MDSKQHRRIFLNNRFQFRLIRRAMLPLASLSLIACVIIWVTTQAEHSYSMTDLRWMGIGGIFALFLASLLGVGWGLVLFSTRLAGPLVQLERILAQIAKGDLSVRVHLRKDDELQEHAQHLNQTFTSLQDRVKRIHQYCKYTRETIDRLAEKNPQGTEKEQLDHMRGLVKLIEEAVADFNVG